MRWTLIGQSILVYATKLQCATRHVTLANLSRDKIAGVTSVLPSIGNSNMKLLLHRTTERRDRISCHVAFHLSGHVRHWVWKQLNRFCFPSEWTYIQTNLYSAKIVATNQGRCYHYRCDIAYWYCRRSQHSQECKTHAGNVLCLVTLTFDLLTPNKWVSRTQCGILLCQIWWNSCIAFWDIVRKNRQTHVHRCD